MIRSDAAGRDKTEKKGSSTQTLPVTGTLVPNTVLKDIIDSSSGKLKQILLFCHEL